MGFVDETAQVSSDNDSISPVVAKRLRPQRPTRTQTAVKDVRTLSEQGAGSELGGAYDSANANALIMDTSMPSIAPNSPAWAGVMYYTQPSPAASSVSARSLEVRSSFDCDPDLVSDQVPVDDFQRQNISPQISDPVEAKLFRYYVKCVGPRIDIVSPENVFTDVIPRLACTNFMLLNAVFMIASQYILRVEPLFPAKPYVYQERTLQLLLAYIARYGKIEDEVALVTAIFLRGFEESHGT